MACCYLSGVFLSCKQLFLGLQFKCHFVRGQINQNAMIVTQVTSGDGVDDPYNYYVNLCRPLVPMPGTNCPAGAWACRVKKQASRDTGKHAIQVTWPYLSIMSRENKNLCMTIGCSGTYI